MIVIVIVTFVVMIVIVRFFGLGLRGLLLGLGLAAAQHPLATGFGGSLAATAPTGGDLTLTHQLELLRARCGSR